MSPKATERPKLSPNRDIWHEMSPEVRKITLEKSGRSITSDQEICEITKFLKEQISDEMEASKKYAYAANKFAEHFGFFEALASMSNDESRHQQILQIMVDILAPKCECVGSKHSGAETGVFSEACGVRE